MTIISVLDLIIELVFAEGEARGFVSGTFEMSYPSSQISKFPSTQLPKKVS